MATTIQVSDSTKQLLEKIKKDENSYAYDEIIAKLAKERLGIPDSFFGRGKGKSFKFTREDRLKLHEL